MAARTKKKTVSRKPAASSGGRRFASIGWLATAAVAGAWAVSDGRVPQHVRGLFDEARGKIVGLAEDDRIASLIDADPEPIVPRHKVAERHVAPAPVERTGSIRPAEPKPTPLPTASLPRPAVPLPLRAPEPKVAVAVPSPTPLLPFAQPRTEASLAKPIAMPATAVPSAGFAPAEKAVAGGERHATRQLTVHAAPDGASQRLAAIESGDSVLVMHSAGDWRYVRNARSKAEGWVDGRYLAGEATADAGLSR